VKAAARLRPDLLEGRARAGGGEGRGGDRKGDIRVSGYSLVTTEVSPPSGETARTQASSRPWFSEAREIRSNGLGRDRERRWSGETAAFVAGLLRSLKKINTHGYVFIEE
jgi:hypothetical protein